jgi:ATP-binding protein involved in chromosome partitioning
MDPRITIIEKRLEHIDKIIAVASGKGGVGKSLVASSLALKLMEKKKKVGLLDLDLYGPSSHIILNINDTFPEEKNGIIPPNQQGINFMSIVYFTEDKPAPFRGIDITNIIIELLAITQWGNLDYLIIDLPPGIGEETLDIIRFISRCEFLVVTTPSKVAIAAVDKLLVILKEMRLPIIGVIENMVMQPTSLIENSIEKYNIPYLGQLSFDTDIEDNIGNPDGLLKTKFINDFESILVKIIV